MSGLAPLPELDQTTLAAMYDMAMDLAKIQERRQGFTDDIPLPRGGHLMPVLGAGLAMLPPFDAFDLPVMIPEGIDSSRGEVIAHQVFVRWPHHAMNMDGLPRNRSLTVWKFHQAAGPAYVGSSDITRTSPYRTDELQPFDSVTTPATMEDAVALRGLLDLTRSPRRSGSKSLLSIVLDGTLFRVNAKHIRNHKETTDWP